MTSQDFSMFSLNKNFFWLKNFTIVTNEFYINRKIAFNKFKVLIQKYKVFPLQKRRKRLCNVWFYIFCSTAMIQIQMQFFKFALIIERLSSSIKFDIFFYMCLRNPHFAELSRQREDRFTKLRSSLITRQKKHFTLLIRMHN